MAVRASLSPSPTAPRTLPTTRVLQFWRRVLERQLEVARFVELDHHDHSALGLAKGKRLARVLCVPVDRFHGKSGEADRDVFGTFDSGGGILHPLAGMGDDSLSGRHVESPGLVRDSQ